MKTNFTPNYAVHPGRILEDDLKMIGMKQKELAEKIGVSKTIVNEIIKGRRNISAKIAMLLEEVMQEPKGFWFSAQAAYDEDKARLNIKKDKPKTNAGIKLKKQNKDECVFIIDESLLYC